MTSSSAPLAPNVSETPSSASDSSSSEDVSTFDLRSLECAVQERPQDFDAHLALINAIRTLGSDVNSLRHARKRFANAFPLPTHLWKEWLSDELRIASTRAENMYLLEDLFPRALEDYLSLELHQMRLELTMKMCQAGQIDNSIVKQTFLDSCARGAVAIGNGGAALWDKYRLFMSERDETLLHFSVSEKNILEEHVFLRNDSERIRQECDVFEAKLKKLLEVEKHQLGDAGEETVMQFRLYADYAKTISPAMAFSVYERCITISFLNSSIWIEYIRYCAKVQTRSVYPLCRRAIRNVPWAIEVWVFAVLFMPEAEEKYINVSRKAELISLIDRVKEIVMVSEDMRGAENLTKACWTTFLGMECTDETLKCVFSTLSFSIHGTMEWASASCYAATVLRAFEKLDRAHDLMEGIVSVRSFEAHWWLMYADLLCDLKRSDSEAIRNLYKRAISVLPAVAEVQKVSDAWIRYEATNTSHPIPLPQRVASVYSFAEAQYSRAKSIVDMPKPKKKREEKTYRKSQQRQGYQRNLPRRKKAKSETSIQAAEVAKGVVAQDTGKGPRVEPEAKKEQDPDETATPTDFKEMQIVDVPNLQGEDKTLSTRINPDKVECIPRSEGDVEPKTVFINNLAFNVSEADLKTEFGFAGKIVQVRIPRRSDGASKGIAYMQFENDECVERALQRHMKPVKGRSVWVRRSRPPARKARKPRGSAYPKHSAKPRPSLRGSMWQLQPRSVKRRNIDTVRGVANGKITDVDMKETEGLDMEDEDRNSVPKTQDDFRAIFLSKK